MWPVHEPAPWPAHDHIYFRWSDDRNGFEYTEDSGATWGVLTHATEDVILAYRAWGMAQDVAGTGETRSEALCRAALALAQAIKPETCWRCGQPVQDTTASAVCDHCGADQMPF